MGIGTKVGRRPKPTNLKLVMGNPGKHPINRNEPKPLLAIPQPPPHISPAAREHWYKTAPALYALGCLSEVDGDAFAIYCTAYSRWVEAEEALARSNGLLHRTKNGNVIQNPLVGIANKAMADAFKYGGAFGKTPVDRCRIDAEIAGRAQVHDDPADDYF